VKFLRVILDQEIDTEYSVRQNYPNPFNPLTEITFAVPKASQVTLSIVDALGRVQAVLVDGERSTGTYSVSWNASHFPSGICVCRFQARPIVGGQAGDYGETKRMTLLK